MAATVSVSGYLGGGRGIGQLAQALLSPETLLELLSRLGRPYLSAR